MWLVCSSMQYEESPWFSGKGRIVSACESSTTGSTKWLKLPLECFKEGFTATLCDHSIRTRPMKHSSNFCHASLRCACRQKNIEVVKLFLDWWDQWRPARTTGWEADSTTRPEDFQSERLSFFAIWISSLSESFRLSSYQTLIPSHLLIAASNLRKHRHFGRYCIVLPTSPIAFPCLPYGGFRKLGYPEIIHLIGFSIINILNLPFWGTSIYGNLRCPGCYQASLAL